MITLYEKFRASFSRDGADYDIIERATGKERLQLEDDLIAHMGYFEIPALAMMGSVKAIPELKRHFPASAGSIKVRIARALWDLENYGESIPKICEVLSGRPKKTNWIEKLDAAIALQGIKHPLVEQTLAEAVYDEEYLVRYHSAYGLALNRGRRINENAIVDAVSDGDKNKIAVLVDRLIKD